MEAKMHDAEFMLEQLYHLNCRIDDAKARINRYREQAEQSTCRYSAVGFGGGCGKSRIESNVIAAVDMEARLEKLIEDLKVKSNCIIGIIDKMDREEYKRVLECRYLDGMHWSEVCDCMHISRSLAFKLREKALASFAEQYEKSCKMDNKQVGC